MLPDMFVAWMGGLGLIASNIAMHAIGLIWITLMLQRLRSSALRPGRSRWSLRRSAILALGMAGASLATLHALEGVLWAVAYLAFGALDNAADAILYSVDSMATRGGSGLMPDEPWRLMGALEAMAGVLLFGLSTAYLFAVLQQIWPLILGHADLRSFRGEAEQRVSP
ncbi:MAG: hypothetical protein AB7F35_02575 [Acetobacteraceae bacterium]